MAPRDQRFIYRDGEAGRMGSSYPSTISLSGYAPIFTKVVCSRIREDVDLGYLLVVEDIPPEWVDLVQ